MYESHFGFHRTPFQSFDPARLFIRSESISEILPRLLRCVRSSLGMALVTSVQGTGRSALLKYLRHELQNEGRTVLVSGAALDSSATLLQLLMHSAVRHAGSAGTPEQSMVACTQWNTVESLRKSMDFWGPVILLLDDVHLAPLSVLNELRAISEEEWNGRSLVRVLATAPVSFEIDLARSEYNCFSHRIRCHEVLQSLTVRECAEYLQRQVEAAGCRLPECFTDEAVNRLVEACDGLPRSLSMLADETLAVAAEQSLLPADLSCVGTALKRLQHLACRLNVSLAAESAEIEHGWASGETDLPVRGGANSRGFEITATVLPERPLAGVVEFGERVSADARQSTEQQVNSSSWVAGIPEPEAGDLEAVDEETAQPGLDEPVGDFYCGGDQFLQTDQSAETGAEPADFSNWEPVPAQYLWMDDAAVELPSEVFSEPPPSAIPRSMSIDIQATEDEEILRLLSERRWVAEPVAGPVTEPVAEPAAGSGDNLPQWRSPENRRDIFGGFRDVSTAGGDVAGRVGPDTLAIPRSLGATGVYSGVAAEESAGESVEQAVEDRFATLFTRLRKLRSEKAGVSQVPLADRELSGRDS